MSSQSTSIRDYLSHSAEVTAARPANGVLRFYVVSALILTVLFAGALAVIHAQKPDDQAILQFLQAPQGCAAPCFMGIQLGVTFGNEAQTILQNHPWVQPNSVYVAEDTTRRFMWISWRWSKASPSFLTGSAYITYAPMEDGHVRDIELRTTLPYGAVWLALGMPDSGSMDLQHMARYSNRWLFVETKLECGHFWERPTGFYMVSPATLDSASDLLHLQPYEAVLKARGCISPNKP